MLSKSRDYIQPVHSNFSAFIDLKDSYFKDYINFTVCAFAFLWPRCYRTHAYFEIL